MGALSATEKRRRVVPAGEREGKRHEPHSEELRGQLASHGTAEAVQGHEEDENDGGGSGDDRLVGALRLVRHRGKTAEDTERDEAADGLK